MSTSATIRDNVELVLEGFAGTAALTLLQRLAALLWATPAMYPYFMRFQPEDDQRFWFHK